MQQFRDTVAFSVLQSKLVEKLTAGIKISDTQALALLQARTSRTTRSRVARPRAHPRQDEGEGAELYDQLLKGASFAKLAKKYSTDKGSAVNGGKLGVQAASALVKPFSDVAFKLKTGALSKPVKTQFGWHIIKPLGPVIPATTTPFAKEKAAIVQQLKQAKNATPCSKWQTQLASVLHEQGQVREEATRRRPRRAAAHAARVRPRPPGRLSLPEALTELDTLARRLRRDCPWDREQTAKTIVPHTDRGGLRGRRRRDGGRRREAPRRARRPPLPGLLPLAAPRGEAGDGDLEAGRAG